MFLSLFLFIFVFCVALTLASSAGPTGKPIQRPSRLPTSHPTAHQSQPTSSPSSSPTEAVPLNAEFIIIDITKAGRYVGKGFRKQFIISCDGDVEITGNGGINHYKVLPFANQRITINDFQAAKDVFDFLQYPSVASIWNIGYQTYPLVLLLRNSQQIRLPNYNTMQLSDQNFIFVTLSLDADESSSPSSALSTSAIIAIVVSGACGIIILGCLIGAYLYRKNSSFPSPPSLSLAINLDDVYPKKAVELLVNQTDNVNHTSEPQAPSASAPLQETVEVADIEARIITF
jgi:hypothetical protein